MENIFRIAIAQLNFLVGDIDGNATKIIEAARYASSQSASLVIFSELSLIGYPSEDLLLRDDFIGQAERGLSQLAARLYSEVPEVGVIVGAPRRVEKRLFNSAFYLTNGKISAHYDKVALPNYSVFDEKRYFDEGMGSCLIRVGDMIAALTVCEDIWKSGGAAVQAKQSDAELLININASPFHLGKSEQRDEILRDRARETKLPIVYVNQVGGQDELVFDGDSRVVSADGTTLWSAPLFEEDIACFDLLSGGHVRHKYKLRTPISRDEMIWRALLTGLRDYIDKNGFQGAVIGLSGGVDSALALVLAVESLGKERVRAVMMPSRYTANISVDDARTLAARVEVNLYEIDIEPIFQAMEKQLEKIFAGMPVDVTEQNIQARIRGNLLMAIANKYQLGVITTSNKSEIAVGYATLYGDMIGAFAPLKDVSKTRVYQLVEFCNREREVIPERIITRPPSAELALGQVDQDNLPPYEIIDAVIEKFIEADASYEEMIDCGFPEDTVKVVQDMVMNHEYKRRQAPPGIKITEKAFGKDRRYPITSGFRPF